MKITIANFFCPIQKTVIIWRIFQGEKNIVDAAKNNKDFLGLFNKHQNCVKDTVPSGTIKKIVSHFFET